METSEFDPSAADRRAWNAGTKVGAKRALKPKQVWAIRFFLDQHRRLRDRALFDLALDSKLRGCDVVRMKIGDVVSGGQVRSRAIVVQRKTGGPCSSSCWPMREGAYSRGWNGAAERWQITCSLAASTMLIT